MTQPLFLDTPVSKMKFAGEEKYAGAFTPMGDNVDNWEQEIVAEAYRRIPYLGEFSVDIGIDRKDEETGFAFGSLVVRPPSQMTSQEEQQRPLSTVHIPVVVREHQLAPFDIFAIGKRYFPLTEGRLREALFRPDLFDAVRERPWMPNMYADLQPPLASSSGIGGGGVKLGADQAQARLRVLTPFLPKLAGQVKKEHVDRVKLAMERDYSVRAAINNAHPGVRAAFASALGLEASDPEKTAQLAWSMVPPNVVQLQKLANGNYLAKWANTEMYEPQSQEMDPIAAQELVGDLDLVGRLESDGTLTASPDAAVKRTLDADEVKAVDSFGMWVVQDANGVNLAGFCFPNVLSLNLQPLPMTLFTNGSQYAIQEKIAGKMIGKSTELPKGEPRGFGCFYYIDHGTARAFVPMSIRNVMRGPDGTQYMAALETGEQVVLHLADHSLKTVEQIGQNEFAIPDTVSWMPLRGQTELVAEPMLMTKVSHASQGEVIGDGRYYTFRGPAFAKLAEEQKSGLKRAEAEFLGVAAGLHEHFVKQALDSTHLGKIVKLGGLKVIGNAGERIKEARARITASLDKLEHPIRNYDLIKEAATMMDAMTADKILGLGFITPENIASFVDSLPSFDLASQQLSEMLLAVRLGMAGPPELAIERCLVALEDIIQGLRRLRHRDLSYRGEE